MKNECSENNLQKEFSGNLTGSYIIKAVNLIFDSLLKYPTF